jgi:hypothetical protein
MSKVQCNQKLISGEGHELNTCPLEKDLIKIGPTKAKPVRRGLDLRTRYCK